VHLRRSLICFSFSRAFPYLREGYLPNYASRLEQFQHHWFRKDEEHGPGSSSWFGIVTLIFSAELGGGTLMGLKFLCKTPFLISVELTLSSMEEFSTGSLLVSGMMVE